MEAEFHRRGYWLLDSPDVILVHYAMVAHSQKRHSSRSSRSRSRSPKRKFQETTTPISPLHLSLSDALTLQRLDLDNSFTVPQPTPPELQIVDYSPSWDFVSGGSKIILVVTSAPGSSERHTLGPNVWAMFGTKAIAVDRVINGVYRFRTPPADLSQIVGGKIEVTLTDGKIRSDTIKFTYVGVPNPDDATSSGMMNLMDEEGKTTESRMQDVNEDEEEMKLRQAFSSITLGDMGINTADIEGDVPDDVFSTAAERIQKQFRTWIYKRHAAAKKLQSFLRGAMVRKSIKRNHNAAKVIQNQFRAQKLRREFQKLKNAAVTIQTTYRAKKRNKKSPSCLSSPHSNRTASAPPVSCDRKSTTTERRESLNTHAANLFAESCIGGIEDAKPSVIPAKQNHPLSTQTRCQDSPSTAALTKSTRRLSLEANEPGRFMDPMLPKDALGSLPKIAAPPSKLMDEEWPQLSLGALGEETDKRGAKKPSKGAPDGSNPMQTSFPHLEENIDRYFS